MNLTIPEVRTGLRRRYGKPLDYGRLGKTFAEGGDFMRHMAGVAGELLERARGAGTLTTVERCPLCDGPAAECFEYLGFHYRQCVRGDCRHAFVAERLPEASRTEFFREDRHYGRTNYCDLRRAGFRVRQIARPKVAHVLEQIDRRGGRWLDVGCGSGEVLAALRDWPGWQGIGLELSEQDADFGRTHLGADIRLESLGEFRTTEPDPRFDVISLFGVLHCISDPAGLLREAAETLDEDGWLVAEVSNFDALTTAAVASFPHHPSRSSLHGVTTLHHFTPESIVRALTAAGLEPVSVWFYGLDVYELLNQWSFSDPGFADSPLNKALCELADDLQRCIDERERSSHMLWIARRR